MLTLGRQMHSEGAFRHMALDEAKVRSTLLACIGEGFLAVNEGRGGVDGGLAGMLTEPWFSHDLIAADVCFFVRPDRRGSITAVRLVQEFTAWARMRGAKEVSIAQSSGVRLEETNRFLTGMGFTYVGGVYKWRFG